MWCCVADLKCERVFVVGGAGLCFMCVGSGGVGAAVSGATADTAATVALQSYASRRPLLV